MKPFRLTMLFLSLFLVGAGCTRTPVLELADEPPEQQQEFATQCASENDNGSVQCSEGNSWCGLTCRAEPRCPEPTTRINCQTCTCVCPDGTLSCVVGTEGNAGIPIEETESVSETGTRPVPLKAQESLDPYYIAFSQEQFDVAKAEGRPVLLYFWAGWCPTCRAEEPGIKALVEGIDVPIAGFRVDFDKESVMKKIFTVPYQHTTVILNTNGTEVARFTGPVSEQTLTAALRDAYHN